MKGTVAHADLRHSLGNGIDETKTIRHEIYPVDYATGLLKGARSLNRWPTRNRHLSNEVSQPDLTMSFSMNVLSDETPRLRGQCLACTSSFPRQDLNPRTS